MKHYHGTPLGGTRESVGRFAVAQPRFFLVPFGRDEDLPVVAECSCGFALDNGAFSAWKSGTPITDWTQYYAWVLKWGRNPRFDFCIAPDVIEGTEDENDALYAEFFRKCKFAEGGWPEVAPVWHMHESTKRVKHLISHCKILCIGSSGEFATVGTDAWHRRMHEAFGVICVDGAPRRKVHGLRMLAPEIVDSYPFASCDSTNVAQNSQLLARFGMYKPPTQSQRREVIAARIEAACSPSVFHAREQLQFTLE